VAVRVALFTLLCLLRYGMDLYGVIRLLSRMELASFFCVGRTRRSRAWSQRWKSRVASSPGVFKMEGKRRGRKRKARSVAQREGL
jgi:hypothetical protein